MKYYKFLLFAILLVNISCSKDALQIETIEDFGNYVLDEMETQNIPALSVLIFHGDEINYELYLGKSSIENDIALESDHLFLLASVSKTITATALLQLYEDGEFQLDDTINEYLSFDVNVPNQQTDITFRMLLTHTSAIEDGSAMDDQYYYGEDSPLSLDYFMENYLVNGGEFYNAEENFYGFEPGTKHKYSNMGNALIAVLVEEISGMGFNTYCRENIFQPMGMANSFWRLDEIEQTIVQPYEYRRGNYNPVQHYTFTDYPNGGLRSNVMDMFRFLSAFTQNGLSNGYQLLESSTIVEMITPQIPDIDDEVGLHLFLMNNKHDLWGHDGGELGVSTIMAFNPTTKVGALIFTNQGDAYLDEMLEEAYKLGIKL